jgi:hypothetical protein
MKPIDVLENRSIPTYEHAKSDVSEGEVPEKLLGTNCKQE